ncbi:MAG: poly-gamma-glutamate biosynthesis protein PgsC/CapC [Methylococcaceae bacterium]|nr:poly-gamma-glutamate biosynthesis protein PgsC/CapC [Methylococcaceae bacterium]
MNIFPIPLFPENSLSSSVIPAVWVGMSVVCFFNLRLGWVLSGLVVPGYLVPLILIKKWAAAVILLESIVTYFLVWFVSEYLSRWAPWCNFFGRDRFFALVLGSVFVRLVFDGWLLPSLGAWATDYWHITFDYRNNLHSFGLIIVSLVANQFWKTGFLRGLIPLLTTLTLTLVIVRYGLMELTNYTLSSVSYLYEDMASSILASPKAYIIVIITAFLASRMNLLYGWDFNGILIPSLLALQWYQPIKIVGTIAESCVILWLSMLMLKTPMLSKMTIEGARKQLLFFNVSLIYKILLGYAILHFFPEQKVTDFFGFGYLLSTLVAVKIHDKGIFARLTRATLETSLVAVIGATFIGFTLTLLPFPKLVSELENITINAEPASLPLSKQEDLESLLREAQVKLYQSKLSEKFHVPSDSDLAVFTNGIEQIKVFLTENDADALIKATELLKQVNYRLDRVNNGRYLYLHEQSAPRGWGTYVIDTQTDSKLALEIPAPLEEPSIFDAGMGLFNAFDARVLSISGSRLMNNADASGNVLTNGKSFFNVFHRVLNRSDVLQISVFDAEMARQVSGVRREAETTELSGLKSSLWVKERLPESLKLNKLKTLIPDFTINWHEPPFENLQRESAEYGFAELMLTYDDIRKLLSRSLQLSDKTTVQDVERNLRIEGYLQEWVLNLKTAIAPKGSQLYQKPKQEELLYLDEQVISPLLNLLFQTAVSKTAILAQDKALQTISQAANKIGFQLVKYKDSLTGQEYFILAEQTTSNPRYWGMYLFRIGESSPVAVEIPRPLFEKNSFEYGVSLFERLKAQALFIATTHPGANSDGSADLIDPNNKLSVFNLLNQVLIRKKNEAPLLLLNVRAFSYRSDRPYPDADMVLSLADGIVSRAQLNPLAQNLLTTLESEGFNVKLLDGSDQTSGYEVGATAQSYYLEAASNKTFAMLWLSPTVRAAYRQQSENLLQAAQFNGLEIPTVEGDLETYLQNQNAFSGRETIDLSFRDQVNDYIDQQDVIRLQQILGNAKALGYSLIRFLDRNSKQAFLVINKNNVSIALTNLGVKKHDVYTVDDRQPLSSQYREYLSQRKTWLLRQVD